VLRRETVTLMLARFILIISAVVLALPGRAAEPRVAAGYSGSEAEGGLAQHGGKDGPAIIAYVFSRNKVIDPAAITAGKLTHINYAFANIADGKIIEGFANDAKNFEILSSLRARNPRLRILISGASCSGSTMPIPQAPCWTHSTRHYGENFGDRLLNLETMIWRDVGYLACATHEPDTLVPDRCEGWRPISRLSSLSPKFRRNP
jgi:hypothetical protein